NTRPPPFLVQMWPASAVQKNRPAGFNAVPQAANLSFGSPATAGVDASARFSNAGLNSSTTALTVTLELKANQQYSFSFYYQKGGPTLKLTDSAGKAVAVNMQNGFTVAKSGTYQLTIKGSGSLKNTANVDNLVLNARSVLPTKSGDANIDALLMGGTRNWWRPDGAVAVVGTEKISSKANGLAAGSSATALTYSFLSAPQAGKDPVGFQQMTSAQKDAVRAVFAQYSKYINVTFTEVNNSGAGDINFGTDIQTGSAGYATLPNSDASGKSYAYLANNSATNNDAGVQEGGYGRLTIMHEVGHALGLKHPGNYNAGGGGSPVPFLSQALDNKQNTMMSYYDNGASKGVNSATPMIFDIAALQYLYGANKSASTASSNGKFEFADGQNIRKVLWSTTGTDTIDLSQLTKTSSVNLNAGTLSSINIIAAAASATYSGNGNVGIAHGSAINRVKLSSASGVAETVTLNAAFQKSGFNTIESLDATSDKIALSKALFGRVSAASIEFGATATKATSRILVHNSTGEVFYDADGNGTKALAKKIAQFTLHQSSTSLSTSNFSFVA
ncbi:MAG: matrixin family metalloprotease, partial [Rhodocyclaceae bacterium]|nr:matrixin family metalloprotease [Rhodocyclaceae bacterium]